MMLFQKLFLDHTTSIKDPPAVTINDAKKKMLLLLTLLLSAKNTLGGDF